MSDNATCKGDPSWPHYFSSQDKSLVNSEGERWAGPAAVPSLVAELALWELRRLLGVDSQVSLEEEELTSLEDHGVVDGVRPSLIAMSDSLSPSPTPFPRRPLRTSSSNASVPAREDQARDALGHFRSAPE